MAEGSDTPTHFLIYNSETRDYRGTASDGTEVAVDEHIFAQRVRLLTQHLMVREGAQYVDTAAYRRLHSAAISRLSNADAWRGEET